jgi:hypothetical protein
MEPWGLTPRPCSLYRQEEHSVFRATSIIFRDTWTVFRSLAGQGFAA